MSGAPLIECGLFIVRLKRCHDGPVVGADTPIGTRQHISIAGNQLVRHGGD